MAIVGMTVATAWARKRRLVGTISAVLLGVAFLAATLVLGDTARAGFADVFGRANAGTDVVVRSESRLQGEGTVQQGLLDASLARHRRRRRRRRPRRPVVEGTAQVLGADGQPVGGDGPPTIGTGWIDDPQLNPFSLAEGRAPAADGEVVLALATAATPGSPSAIAPPCSPRPPSRSRSSAWWRSARTTGWPAPRSSASRRRRRPRSCSATPARRRRSTSLPSPGSRKRRWRGASTTSSPTAPRRSRARPGRPSRKATSRRTSSG